MLDKITQAINNTVQITPRNYFPLSYNLLNSEHSSIFNQKITQNQEESLYYSSIIKNLILDVFIIEDSNPNAFTIPGVDSISILKHNPLDYQFLGLQTLMKHPLSATLSSNNKIIFESDIKNFKVLVFLNSGLFKKVPNIDDRLAIVLHELGHWVYIKNLLDSDKFETLASYTDPIVLSTFLISNIYSNQLASIISILVKIVLTVLVSIKNKQNEYDADRFTKDMGYGNHLQNALSLLAYNKPINRINIEDKDKYIDNILDTLSMMVLKHSHPQTHKRILALNESEGFMDMLKTIISIIDKIISNNKGLTCKFL